MTDESPEIEFDPETLRAEASERVEAALDELTERGDGGDDSDPPVDPESALRAYEEHRANMVLYRRVAVAESKRAEAQDGKIRTADVAARYTDITLAHDNTKETLSEIPEIDRRTADLVEWVRRDDGTGVPDALASVRAEVEEINDIHETLNTTITDL